MRSLGSEEVAGGVELRLAAAVRHGCAPAVALETLDELAELERREYFKRTSGLSESERTRMWQLRAELLGGQPLDLRFNPDRPLAGLLADYWSWLVETAHPAVVPGERRARNALPGDLAAAAGRDPERVGWVVETWTELAQGLGLPSPVGRPALRRMHEVLARCTAHEAFAPTHRTVALANSIAVLSGLPDELVIAHSEEWDRQRKTLRGTEEFIARERMAGSIHEYRGRRTGPQFLPRLEQTRTGTEYLVLPPVVAGVIESEVYSRVIIGLVQGLRRGDLPRSGLALRAARNVYTDWLHGKRDDDGMPKERPPRPSVGPLSDDGPSVESGSANAGPRQEPLADAAMYLAARHWLSNEVDRGCRRLLATVQADGPNAVFPADVYGSHRTSAMGSELVWTARNFVQQVASSSWLARATVPVPPPRTELVKHMRATLPGHWDQSARGRQLIQGYAGAVAVAAWRLVQPLGIADAPDAATEILRPLIPTMQCYIAIAAIDALRVAMTRFGRPNDEPRPGWLASIEAGAAAITEFCSVIALRLAWLRPMALGALVDDLATLATSYRERLDDRSDQPPARLGYSGRQAGGCRRPAPGPGGPR